MRERKPSCDHKWKMKILCGIFFLYILLPFWRKEQKKMWIMCERYLPTFPFLSLTHFLLLLLHLLFLVKFMWLEAFCSSLKGMSYNGNYKLNIKTIEVKREKERELDSKSNCRKCRKIKNKKKNLELFKISECAKAYLFFMYPVGSLFHKILL
jgi:hypothetical protein